MKSFYDYFKREEKVDALVEPGPFLEFLSRNELEHIYSLALPNSTLYSQFRQCCLAILNCGSETDDLESILNEYDDFKIEVIRLRGGLRLKLTQAPGHAFVDGEIIYGIKKNLFSTLRDLIYMVDRIKRLKPYENQKGSETTNLVFELLRHAGALPPDVKPNIVLCWGGHSISREEYEYTKQLGYQLGLRGYNICTGSGNGAMIGPMKGAHIGHAKQKNTNCRYIGISEPGIIAAESPNPIVSELIIMPDMEKRLESFCRLAHGIVVFPGGVGTAEEILYLLGILLHPKNKNVHMPLFFTAPDHSKEYFSQIDEFIGGTLGEEAQKRYKIIINDPEKVARGMRMSLDKVKKYRRQKTDAFHFNWDLFIESDFQKPFIPNHESMGKLSLHSGLPPALLAGNLRKVMSGIVTGNLKEHGIRQIREKGPFELRGDRTIIRYLESLLKSFVHQKRIRMPLNSEIKACYRTIIEDK